MSKVKVTGSKQILPQFGHFWTVIPVWIHRWLWNDTQSLQWHRRGALLFFKVIHQISRSHRAKNADFDPNGAFLDCDSGLNLQMDMKWCTKLNVALKRCHTIPTFGNRCLSVIGGGKQWSRLAGWVQLSAEAAPGPHGVPPAPMQRIPERPMRIKMMREIYIIAALQDISLIPNFFW